jgi:hypothetical protein
MENPLINESSPGIANTSPTIVPMCLDFIFLFTILLCYVFFQVRFQ